MLKSRAVLAKKKSEFIEKKSFSAKKIESKDDLRNLAHIL